eukprot:2134788-Amphidinium_carterae.1
MDLISSLSCFAEHDFRLPEQTGLCMEKHPVIVSALLGASMGACFQRKQGQSAFQTCRVLPRRLGVMQHLKV